MTPGGAGEAQQAALLHNPPHIPVSLKPPPVPKPLVLHQLVDMMLGTVLAGGHLKHEGDAEQGFLGIPVGNNLWGSRGAPVSVLRVDAVIGDVVWAQAWQLDLH